jgi:hypothetical protein
MRVIEANRAAVAANSVYTVDRLVTERSASVETLVHVCAPEGADLQRFHVLARARTADQILAGSQPHGGRGDRANDPGFFSAASRRAH